MRVPFGRSLSQFLFNRLARRKVAQRPSARLRLELLESRIALSGDFEFAFRLGSTGTDLPLGAANDAAGNIYLTGQFRGAVDFDPGPSSVFLTATANSEAFVAKYTPAGSFLWARRVGGVTASDSSMGMDISVDGIGNLFVTGEFRGTADFDTGAGVSHLSSAGDRDAFVLKLSTAGEFLWALRVGSSGSDSGTDIVVDNDGSLYTTGTYTGSVDFDPGSGVVLQTSVGLADVFVWKLNALGNFVWVRSVGGLGSDQSNAIALDNIGNVYTGGRFSDQVDFNPGSGIFLMTAGGIDGFVWKLDRTGNFVWARQMGGGGDADDVLDLAVDAGGNVHAAGHFTSFFDFDPGPGFTDLTAEAVDGFVWKLDRNGNLLWARSVGGIESDTSNALRLDSGGNVYVTGSFRATADFDPGPDTHYLTSITPGNNDAYIWALNSAGQLVWVRTLGSSRTIASHALTLDQNSRVNVAGGFDGTTDFDPGSATFFLTSAGENDAFLLQLRQDPRPAGLDLTNRSVTENGAAGRLVGIFSLTDVDPALSVTYTLIPGPGSTSNAFFSISNDRLLSAVIFSRAEQETHSIRVRAVYSGGLQIERVFLVTILPNALPTITAIPNQTTVEDRPTDLISFIVSDQETFSDFLTVRATSSNPALLPEGNIVLGGAQSLRTVRIIPLAFQSGVATVTLRVTDELDGATVTTSFQVTVTPIDDLPTLTTNTGLAPMEGGTVIVTSAQLLVTDVDHPPTQVVFTLTAVPTRGSLYRNGVPLAVGGTFTQQDILDGRIRYAHDGSESTADSFSFNLSNGLGGGARTLTLVSEGVGRVPGNGPSDHPAVSLNGRFVAFHSWAGNLVPGDTNGFRDVFIYDRKTAYLDRLSVGGEGVQGNSDSGIANWNSVSLSADGRYAVFTSRASNLTPPGGLVGNIHVYLRDRLARQTELVSISSLGVAGDEHSGVEGLALSADGQVVAFSSVAPNLVPGDNNNFEDIFLRDRRLGRTTRISVASDGTEANERSFNVALSADGRFAVFTSRASNLVPGDTNSRDDIFLHDRVTGQTTRVSVSSSGAQGNSTSFSVAISADGRYLGFDSEATNLVPGDTNNTWDIFVRDRLTGQTTRASVSASGTQGNHESYSPSLSADGRLLVFDSYATTLIPGIMPPGQIFGRDQLTGQLTLLSTTGTGTPGNSLSWQQVLSGDGQGVAFSSMATNFVPGIGSVRQQLYVLHSGLIPGHVAVDITPINDLPTISNIPDLSIPASTSTGPLAFVIGDAETPADMLTIGVASSNPMLVPPSNIVIMGNGANRTVTVTPLPNQTGTAVITLTVGDRDGDTATESFVLTVVPSPFRVNSLTLTSTGFTAQFNRSPELTTLNLYDAQGSGLGAADVILTSSVSGPVRGSLVVDSSISRITFLATGGVLPPATYTITLRSAADGFRDTAGQLLDGNGDGVPGGDFTTSLPVTSSTAVVVSIPDFLRGPGQMVDVPPTSMGLPLRLSASAGITSVSLTLRYDSRLLTITGGTVASGLPTGAAVTVNTSTPGTAVINFTSPTLSSGITDFVKLTATVPDSAGVLYTQKHILDLTSISINGGAIAALDDDGLHVNAYFGDATGNARYSATDATRALRVAVGLDSGFSAYQLADPVVVADITGNGQLNSTDATRLLQESIGIDRLEIPALPTNPPTIAVSGPDPLLNIPRRFRARRGSLVTVPVNLDPSDGLDSANLALSYDPRQLEVVKVARGSLTLDFDLFAVNHDAEAGTLRVGLGRSAGGITGRGSGSMLLLTFRIKLDAPAGRAVINLRQDLDGLATLLNDGGLDLIPDPSNQAGDVLDGVILVASRADRQAGPSRARPGSELVSDLLRTVLQDNPLARRRRLE